MIDWTRVDELRCEVGEAGFAEIAGLFLEEVDEAAAQLSADATAEATADAMHFLKGSALNLGFTALGALCAAGEQVARAGGAVDIDAVRSCLAESRAAFLAGLDGAGRSGC